MKQDILKTLVVIILVITAVTLVLLWLHDQRVQQQGGEAVSFAPTPRLVQQQKAQPRTAPNYKAPAQQQGQTAIQPAKAYGDMGEESEYPVPVTGTHFEAADSDITVDVSSEVTMELEVGDGIFRMSIAPSDGTRTFTVSGLAPLATLHKYIDDRRNHEVLTTDTDGTLSFSADTSNSALIWVQKTPSTFFIGVDGYGHCDPWRKGNNQIECVGNGGTWTDDNTTPGGDCTSIGTWDSNSPDPGGTCKLTTDLTVDLLNSQTIQINDDFITLNCKDPTTNDDHLLSSDTGKNASGWTEAVVLVRGVSDVIVENCVIETYEKGIAQSWRGGGSRNIFRYNTISDTRQALQFSGAPLWGRPSEDNTVFDNDVSDFSGEGIDIYANVNVTVEANDVIAPSNSWTTGIRLRNGTSNSFVIDNDINNTGNKGISLDRGDSNTVYNNRITDFGFLGIAPDNQNHVTIDSNTIVLIGDPLFNSAMGIGTSGLSGVILPNGDPSSRITNNTIEIQPSDPNKWGVGIYQDAHHTGGGYTNAGVTIADNNITISSGVKESELGAGIHLTGGANDFIVRDNIITTTGTTGILMGWSYAGNYDHMWMMVNKDHLISDNTISGAARSIILLFGENVTIEGNTITDSGSMRLARGSGNYILNNTIEDGTDWTQTFLCPIGPEQIADASEAQIECDQKSGIVIEAGETGSTISGNVINNMPGSGIVIKETDTYNIRCDGTWHLNNNRIEESWCGFVPPEQGMIPDLANPINFPIPTGNVISHNVITKNAGGGLELYNPSNTANTNAIIRNNIYRNAGYQVSSDQGINLVSSDDGAGNWYQGNCKTGLFPPGTSNASNVTDTNPYNGAIAKNPTDKMPKPCPGN